jgi:hypothetical protein
MPRGGGPGGPGGPGMLLLFTGGAAGGPPITGGGGTPHRLWIWFGGDGIGHMCWEILLPGLTSWSNTSGRIILPSSLMRS